MPWAWGAAVWALILLARAGEEDPPPLPDWQEPRTFRTLRCSACKMATFEMRESLLRLKWRLDDMGRTRPREDEIIDHLQDVCATMRRDYGLVVKKGKPRPYFTRNYERVSGEWVDGFLEDRCNEIINAYEDEIQRKWDKWGSLYLTEAYQYICSERCSAKQLARKDEL
eukprot:TRINITY_DN6232_c0_g1_i1.p2 TRINITY_DN6232_c0_g1~~TRINITY_DN6232_c0_g1_i1.p2  ORF type:complete len:183 (+),score=73.03 TRINITY_DN6232_c0_g1_i1:45-551(+)